MEPGRRHGRAQPREERKRIEVDRERAVGESFLQRDADETIGASGDALLCDRRTKHVAALDV